MKGTGIEPRRETETLRDRVWHWITYYVLLNFSVGVAIRSLLDQAVIEFEQVPESPLSMGILALIAGILALSSVPPRYRRIALFSAISLVVAWALTTAFGLLPELKRSVYPLIQTVLIWISAFLIAYAITFEMSWKTRTR